MTTATTQPFKERNLLAVMGDEDSVTGLLLAGIGHADSKHKSNFLVVDSKTSIPQMLETFNEWTRRRDIAIILINQHVANEIRDALEEHQRVHPFPVILEIPSKQRAYDPEQDSIIKRIQRLLGSE